MPSQGATIESLILAAANGASTAVTKIREDANIPVYLDEFEIEVTYSCETDYTYDASTGGSMNFWIFKSSFDVKTSYHRKVTYGLRVTFRFVGKEPKT